MTVETDNLPEEGTPAAPAPATAADTSLAPEAIRNSPEYRQLAAENRKLARQRGDAEAREAQARGDAEALRAQSEATSQAAVQAEIEKQLGPEGVAFWDEFAELSATDPVAAARRLAEFKTSQATTLVDDNPAPEVPEVPQSQTPPPPRTMDAGSPLSSVADNREAEETSRLEKTYSDTVERNQRAPNRVMDSERAEGFISYLQAGYRKARSGRS